MTYTHRSSPRNPARNHPERPDPSHLSERRPPIPDIEASHQLEFIRHAKAYTSSTLQPFNGIEHYINSPRKHTPIRTIYRISTRYRICLSGVAYSISE